MELTDEQWAILEPLIPALPVRDDGKGRPWTPTRDVLNGILWVMRTGAPWKDMPRRYPPCATARCARSSKHSLAICESEAGSIRKRRSWTVRSRGPKRGALRRKNEAR